MLSERVWWCGGVVEAAATAADGLDVLYTLMHNRVADLMVTGDWQVAGALCRSHSVVTRRSLFDSQFDSK